MAGFTRRLFVVLGVAVVALLLVPAVAAVAQQEEYPPSVSPADASKTAAVHDPAKSLAFTGSSDAVPMIWIAAGFVVFGGALVFVARQRRSASIRT